MSRYFKYYPLVVLTLALSTQKVAAQGTLDPVVGGVTPINPATGDLSLSVVIDSVLRIVFWVATLLAIIYLIISGISYVTAGGDSEKADGARKGIVNAIIGLVIIALAYVIVGAVTRSVGTPGGTDLFDPGSTGGGGGGGPNVTPPNHNPDGTT